MDAGDSPARRGGAAPQRDGQSRHQPARGTGRRGAGPIRRGSAVNDDCLKLTTYGGERARSGTRYVADALLDVYGGHELAISVLLRGALGFGAKHHLRTD